MAGSFVIVGDGIAGSSAAETIRERRPEADITVLTDEGEPLYNRILIKEYAKGKLPEAPIAIHDEAWYEDRSIDLQLNTPVTAIDPDERVVHTAAEEAIPFDRVLIATGGTPAQLPVPGADAPNVHHFWTFEDARRIREHVESATTGVIIGAGLLGIDLAAVCGSQGVDATYLMRGSRWWRDALTETGAGIVHDAMREIGIDLVFHREAERFECDSTGTVVATIDDAGHRYPSEWVGVAIGLHYNTELLQDVDVECDWGILTDEYMQTSNPVVFAAGDITRYRDAYLGARTQNGSWGSAKEQGQVAGANMVAGLTDDAEFEPFRWVPSYSITHFEMPFLSFGHPTAGSDTAERRYGDREWRRLAFEDGRLVGGVLLGNLSPQRAYKDLIRDRRSVADEVETLLAPDFSVEDLA